MIRLNTRLLSALLCIGLLGSSSVQAMRPEPMSRFARLGALCKSIGNNLADGIGAIAETTLKVGDGVTYLFKLGAHGARAVFTNPYSGIPVTAALGTAAVLATKKIRESHNKIWVNSENKNIIDELGHLLDINTVPQHMKLLHAGNKQWSAMQSLKDAQSASVLAQLKQEFPEVYSQAKKSAIETRSSLLAPHQEDIDIAFAEKMKPLIVDVKKELAGHIQLIEQKLVNCRLAPLWWDKLWEKENPNHMLISQRSNVDQYMYHQFGTTDMGALTEEQYEKVHHFAHGGDWYKQPIKSMRRALFFPEEGRASQVYIGLKMLLVRLNILENKVNEFIAQNK